MLKKIQETAAYLAAKVKVMPKTAIILGTGLGELVNHIDIETSIPYNEFPCLPLKAIAVSSFSASWATRTLWLCKAASTTTKVMT